MYALLKNVEVKVSRSADASGVTRPYVRGLLQDPNNRYQSDPPVFISFSEVMVSQWKEHLPTAKGGVIPDAEYANRLADEAFAKEVKGLEIMPTVSIEEYFFNKDGNGIDKLFVSMSPEPAAGTTRNVETTMPCGDGKFVNCRKDKTIVCKDRTRVPCIFEYCKEFDPLNPKFDEWGNPLETKYAVDDHGRPVTRWMDKSDPETLGSAIRDRMWMSVRSFAEKYPLLIEKLPADIRRELERVEESAPVVESNGSTEKQQTQQQTSEPPISAY